MSHSSPLGLCPVLLGLVLTTLTPSCKPPGEVWVKRPVETALEAPALLPLIEQRIPVVQGTINGHPARLLLDSGAESSLLDAGFARDAGLHLIPLRNTVTSGHNGERAVQYQSFARVATLALDTALAHEVEVLIMDMEHFSIDLDGIVGMDVLGNWIVSFDSADAAVRILPPGDVGTVLSDVYAEGTIFLGLPWVLEDGRPSVTLSFEGGLEFDVVIDTGAVLTSFPTHAIEALGLEASGTNTIQHVGGVSEQTTFLLPRLSFDDVHLKGVTVNAVNTPTGLLGYAALKRFAFVLDGPGRVFSFSHQPRRVGDSGQPTGH